MNPKKLLVDHCAICLLILLLALVFITAIPSFLR